MSLLAVTAVSFVLLAPLCAQAFSGRGDSGSDATPGPGTDSTTVTVTRVGSQPSAKGPADHFTGSVRVDMLFLPEEPSRVSCGLVTFEPGARTAWHAHPLGQRLLVTAGVGWVGQSGGPVQVIRPDRRVEHLLHRDRSLVTVSALVALNRPEQLRSHMARARGNGVTQDELIETITHLEFW